jgi:topoisomerase-4 subunit A
MNGKTRKCATVVGDVLGRYHPHGDASVYDAMVRLGQHFSMRYMPIQKQGNFGGIDGSPAAAYRYTEAKMSNIAEEMVADIKKDTVDFLPNFDDTRQEPTVLPAKFPFLLCNGSNGIAVGMATNMPPHNLREVASAIGAYIDNPDISIDELATHIKGPDFPTGGVVEGKEGLIQAYETGKGKVVVKAKTEIVKEKGTHQIIIHEIPYDVLKENLRKKIEDIKIDKKVDGIVDVFDVSDREHMGKMIIELKKDANAELILNYLLKNTELQVNYNFNIVAIDNKRPKQLGLLNILDSFIAHQKEVITRRTQFDLDHAKARYHILEGLVKAISILDEVIRVIRSSKNKSDAIDNLVKEFEFTPEQSKAIVELQLYRLTNTDIVEIENEMKDLENKINIWTQILKNEEALKHVMKTELKLVKKEFATPRRTEIRDEVTEVKVNQIDLIQKENVIVVVTNEGYVKRISLKSYTAACSEPTILKPGDYITGIYSTTTLDTLLLFTNQGHYLYVPIHEIVETKWKDMGKHISNTIPLAEGERVVSSLMLDSKDTNIILSTKQGATKRTTLSDLIVSRYSKPINAMKLKENDELVSVVKDNGRAIFISKNGYYLNIKSEEIPIVGAKASGVKGINLKEDDLVTCLSPTSDIEYLTVITDRNTAKRIKLSDLEEMTRAKKGSTLIKKVKSTPYKVANVIPVTIHSTIGIKANGDLNDIKATDIPIMDLSSTGSNISKASIEDTFIFKEIEEIKNNEEIKPSNEEEKVDIPQPVQEEAKELTIDDFIDDFKL